MADDRWNRLWEVFHDAIEHPPEAREAFARRVLADDPGLLDELLALLEAHVDSEAFLEEPLIVTSEVLDELEPEAMIGQQVGAYLIREVVGEGGMGVVYQADQLEPVRRRVALKIIRLGMNTREVVARFERERQALAVMSHANVAKVYDAGSTDDGRPYFVMEYVDGVPITDYCDAHRLSNRDRLEICRDVFAGIQHAHQKGLIHRDIKPSNVLIESRDGERPAAKIIDFGIAKATDPHAADKTVFTRLGRLVGTPAYMSPEQADPHGVDIDTRSDIYSLCVLLYELLTGRVPFENQTLLSAGYAEMQRIIREDDPPTPSSRVSHLDAETVTRIAACRHSTSAAMRRELAGDLDWIIMKGLEKDPTRRYVSVSALAEDVERHLGNEPVLARPPGTIYRTRKFVRRHLVGVNLALLGLVVAIAFMVSTVRQSRQLARALTAAEQEQAKAERVSAFLIELLTESDPNVAQGDSVTIREALDRGAEKIAGELDDQPDIKLAVLVQMGSIYRQLGLYDQARQLFEQAKQVSQALDSPDPAARGELELAIGNLAHDEGEYPAAEAAYLEALELLRSLDRDTRDLAVLQNDLGELYVDTGKYDTAIPYHRDSLAMSRRLNDGDHEDTANALQGLGYTYLMAGNLDAAGPLFEEAVAMERRLNGDRSNQVATSLNYYAVYLRRKGDFEGAIAALQESLSIYEEILGPEHPFVATNLSNLANAAAGAGRLDEAEDYARRAIDVYESVFDEPHPNLATAWYVLASIQMKRGQYAEAEQAFRRTLDVDLGMLEPDHPRVLMDKEQVAVADKHLGRLEEAESLQREVLAGRIASLGPDHYSVANAHVNLSSILALEGRLDEAGDEARQAIALLETSEPDTPRMFGSKTQLASVLYQQGDYAGAEALYGEILEAQRAKLGDDHPDVAATLHGIGLARLARGLPAAEPLSEALRIREATLGAEHPDTRATREALARAQ